MNILDTIEAPNLFNEKCFTSFYDPNTKLFYIELETGEMRPIKKLTMEAMNEFVASYCKLWVKLQDLKPFTTDAQSIGWRLVTDLIPNVAELFEDISSDDKCSCTEEPIWNVGGRCIICNKP